MKNTENKNAVKLVIETHLPGEKNDVRISGLTLLSRRGILEQVYWHPHIFDCSVAVTAIDDERNRIEVYHPRIAAHRNLTGEGMLRIFNGAIIVDAAVYRTGTIRAPKTMKLESASVSDGSNTVFIEPDMYRNFWRLAKTVFMRAIETEQFDYFDCVKAAKDMYCTHGEPICQEEEEVILKICEYMRHQYWENLYRKQSNDSVKVKETMDTKRKEHFRKEFGELDAVAEDGIYAVPPPDDLFMGVDALAALKRSRELGRPLTEDERAEFEQRGDE